MNNNLTALISCFARAYHYKNHKFKIFDDYLADKILDDLEYEKISQNMIDGINYFNANFKGSKKEVLRYIVDNQLSPTVLGRSLYLENQLKVEKNLGLKQYLVFASGYDTSAYRYIGIKTFELDKGDILEDKKRRLMKADIDYSNINYIASDFKNNKWITELLNQNYNKDEKSFCSLLGISYYLSKKEFEHLIKNISNIICNGSSIIFDYPTPESSKESILNEDMAKGANEKMKSKYTLKELEFILSKYDLLIYENMNYDSINNELFYNYNALNPNNKILALKDVNYCLAVKKSF